MSERFSIVYLNARMVAYLRVNGYPTVPAAIDAAEAHIAIFNHPHGPADGRYSYRIMSHDDTWILPAGAPTVTDDEVSS